MATSRSLFHRHSRSRSRATPRRYPHHPSRQYCSTYTKSHTHSSSPRLLRTKRDSSTRLSPPRRPSATATLETRRRSPLYDDARTGLVLPWVALKPACPLLCSVGRVAARGGSSRHFACVFLPAWNILKPPLTQAPLWAYARELTREQERERTTPFALTVVATLCLLHYEWRVRGAHGSAKRR